MLSDAASLRHVSSAAPGHACQDHVPAIVIVAVDVKHFLALDTKNTTGKSVDALTGFFSLSLCYPESTHSVRPGGGLASAMAGREVG